MYPPSDKVYFTRRRSFLEIKTEKKITLHQFVIAVCGEMNAADQAGGQPLVGL